MIERKLIYSNTHQKCTLLSNSITIFFLLIQICTNTMYCDHVNVQNYKIVNFSSCFRMHGWFLSIECTFSPQIHYVCEDPQVIINNWKFLYDDIKKIHKSMRLSKANAFKCDFFNYRVRVKLMIKTVDFDCLSKSISSLIKF